MCEIDKRGAAYYRAGASYKQIGDLTSFESFDTLLLLLNKGGPQANISKQNEIDGTSRNPILQLRQLEHYHELNDFGRHTCGQFPV
jgi:hypothetical protein